jgi:hypothetical protein
MSVTFLFNGNRSAEGSSWSQRFDNSIPVPGGAVLETLRDAGAYIARLPDDAYLTEPWRAATHLLIEALEGSADRFGPLCYNSCAYSSVLGVVGLTSFMTGLQSDRARSERLALRSNILDLPDITLTVRLVAEESLPQCFRT